MISGEAYRLLLVAVFAVGLVAGGRFLLAYRPTHWLRDPTARDASGWVLIIVGLYVYAMWQIVYAWVVGIHPPARPLSALGAVVFLVALDVALVDRLRRLMAILTSEREHPTRVCRRCAGRGVVPVGTARDHFDIPFDNGAEGG